MTLDYAILRSAAWLVPGGQRAEWLAEWSAELWYIRQRSARQAIAFCLGAFPDALWLRRNNPGIASGWPRLDSPAQCLGLLGALAAVCGLLALGMPSTRATLVPTPYPEAEDLVIISHGSQAGGTSPTVAPEEYESLAARLPRQIAEVAFYRPIVARGNGANLSVALAEENLFDMLGIRIPRGQAGPKLVLSDSAWRKFFGGSRPVAGREAPIAGRLAIVAAVIPDNSWRLPGRFDAWLVDGRLPADPGRTKGFVLGRLRRPHRGQIARVVTTNDNGSYRIFDCVPLRPLSVPGLLAMTLVALVLLPATTRLHLGEYPGEHACRRLVFLASKIILVIPIVFFSMLVLGAIMGPATGPHGALIGYVLAFRWVLLDQRGRCPECLRLLAHPTRIGQPSQTFLGWYGTESVCMKGHGLLHVPEIPTISFGRQRWVHLDASWSVLFACPETGRRPV